MKEEIENDIEFSEELFMKTFNELKRNKKEKYRFIIEGGQAIRTKPH